ncbi:hypothetical protein ACVMB0_004311 [Bradyrhizobium sp. USDA 4451]
MIDQRSHIQNYSIIIPIIETKPHSVRTLRREPAALARVPGMVHLTKKLALAGGSIHKPFTARSLI